MTFIECQFMVSFAHAMRAQAEIVSGAYKLSNISSMDKVQKTDECKLQDKVEEMKRHIHSMHEISDSIYVKQQASK